MINFHCTIIPVVVLDNVITHTSAWFLNREIHQFVFCKKIQQIKSCEEVQVCKTRICKDIIMHSNILKEHNSCIIDVLCHHYYQRSFVISHTKL